MLVSTPNAYPPPHQTLYSCINYLINHILYNIIIHSIIIQPSTNLKLSTDKVKNHSNLSFDWGSYPQAINSCVYLWNTGHMFHTYRRFLYSIYPIHIHIRHSLVLLQAQYPIGAINTMP